MKLFNACALILVSVLTVASQTVQAREFADIYTDCGLGAMIAPNNDAVAAVTNVTWDLGTTAISSNISSPDTCQGGRAQAAAFIYETHATLEQDLARGQGEHLDALLALASCESAQQGAMVSALRTGLMEQAQQPGYTEQDAYHRAEGLYKVFDQSLQSGACNIG